MDRTVFGLALVTVFLIIHTLFFLFRWIVERGLDVYDWCVDIVEDLLGRIIK